MSLVADSSREHHIYQHGHGTCPKSPHLVKKALSRGAESRGSLGRESQLAEDRKRESRAAGGGGAWLRGPKVVLSMELVHRGGRGADTLHAAG